MSAATAPRTLAAVHATLAAAVFLACSVLLLAIHDGLPRRSELTLYQPSSLRFPAWVMRSQPKKNEEATEMQPRPELVGAPTDWRDNINFGYHPDEARVPEDEAQDAMQTLINAAGSGETVPASEAMQNARRQRAMSTRITQARVEASKGASQQQLAKIMSTCKDHPSDLRCSEYPTGPLTPAYDKARYGPHIKVPKGAIRNVEGSAEDTDSRRRSAPESNYDYEVHSLTANYEDQESPQRRSKDGYHGQIDAQDPMGRLERQKVVPLHTYEKARYGPGIKSLNKQRMSDAMQLPALQLRQRRVPEAWKARYGAYGVYPFQKGDSDDDMAFGAKQPPHPVGQEYFKAKYGPTGYSMFNLDVAADSQGMQQVRLPSRQWHAE